MIALVISVASLAAIFFFAWLWARRIGNYSIVDAVWALSFSVPVIIYSIISNGWQMRSLVVAVLIISWSLRLGIYLTKRISKHHPDEDRRYLILREKWPSPLQFLIFFLAQALLVFLLTLPAWLISRNPTPTFSGLELAGIGLWITGLIGEAISDLQLQRHKRQFPGTICDTGMWKFSRHPNYFFQSLLWWGLFLIAIPAPFGFWAILAPVAILVALLKITGIPLTERLSLEKRGEAYRKYQSVTSPFFPLPPRKPYESD